MLDFQRIHFSKKRPLECATPFVQPNCENKSSEPDHQIPNQYPIRRFLTVITNFLRPLSQKKDNFSGIINQVLKMFWFQALRKSRLKIKEFFEWIMSASKQHHDIPIRGHSHHKHTPKRTFASWHAPRGHLHHDVPTRSIRIMTYPLEGIWTIRFLPLHPTRRHLHHD